ncbi:TonB-dependent receptor [Steroidobacter cummioxidans]|uniref:TonB-dependent receptor n=1 Tax=Steroidobacter cummioxidans TaxID=1803913 RepID=UPI000E31A359|nr:TonB-dependent receptor [Steroidobacter cummioxidans]
MVDRRLHAHNLRQGRRRSLSVPLAAALSVTLSHASAQSNEGAVLEQVIVTAQKRQENLQEVPLSITALGTAKLEELHVTNFEDYAKFLPSLSYTSFGPGFSRVFFRGVSSGDNGNHSGPMPSVGMYLDEQPITTITGALDVHVYDIERVEALAGPQGTLYGASSQAGTIRIITNKPDPSKFAAGYDVEGNMLGGEAGYVAEGFANLPVSDNAAIRLVGWGKRDAGYISNVAADRLYPTAEITINNADRAKKDYNDVDTYGARAALRVDLNDSWTLTPTLMHQQQKSNGAFAYDPSLGDLNVARYRPERADDRWTQAALTVEGKIANLDVVYAGSYLKRSVDTEQDYSDYSLFYDITYYYTVYNDDGVTIEPTQYIQGKDRYKRQSHEIRLSTPADKRVRFVGGLFYQRQQHLIEQRYKIDDLTAVFEVSDWPDTIWLTEQTRVDRDYAVFGEVSFDLTDHLTLTGGARWFKAENSLAGFFGYGDGFSTSGSNGEALCSGLLGNDAGDRSGWVPYHAVGTAPCKNLDKSVKEDGVTPKVNLTYKFDDSRMVYVTYSEGFRPGGVNRRGTFPPYDADFLKNYEVGWKTTWMDNRLRFNGAVFLLDWDDFQFSFTGENGLTNITNAGGARIKGIETDVEFAATESLLISGGLSVLDAKLRGDFCELLDGQDRPLPLSECFAADPHQGPDVLRGAGDGTTLPSVPDYKANLTGRYRFQMGSLDAFAQAALVYQSESRAALTAFDETILGKNRAYSLADFSVGFGDGAWTAQVFVNNAFDKRADITRFAQCREEMCTKPYIVTNQPRTIGVKFGQRF